MADSNSMTVRLKGDLKAKLKELAKSTNRSPNYLVNEAVAEYVDVNAWQIEGIKEAIKQADAGQTVPHEKVRRWIESLGGENELPMPKTST